MPRRQRPFSGSSRPTPTIHGTWKHATDLANASWRQALDSKRKGLAKAAQDVARRAGDRATGSGCRRQRRKKADRRTCGGSASVPARPRTALRAATGRPRRLTIWRKRGLPQPGNDDDLRRGVAALEEFIRRFPSHKLAAAAHLEIAQSQLHRGHGDEAVATLRRFLQDPRWKHYKEVPQARWTLGLIYQGQKKYAEALAVWHEYLAVHAASENCSAVQQAIIDTEYLMGLESFQAGDDAAATRLLTEFMDRYPLDARNPDILFMFGQIHQRKKQWDAAIADWQRLLSSIHMQREASHAQFMIART